MGKNQSLEDLLDQLKIHSKSEDHERVLECAGNILKQSPNDKNALHSKLVTLIKLDKFSQALKLVKDSQQLETSFPVEYAYVLYKTENFEELHEKFDSFKGDGQSGLATRAILHILAQARYRQEDLAKAEEIYKKIIKPSSVDASIGNEKSDLLVNQSAVSALQAVLGTGSSNSSVPSNKRDLSYDHLFNIATEQIGLGNFSTSLELLREAQLACKDAPYLQTPQEIAEEVAPILIQAAYVNSILGNKTEAKSILEESVNLQGLSPGLVKLIGTNNLLALRDVDEDVTIENDIDKTVTSAEALSQSVNAVKTALKSLIELEKSSTNDADINVRINSLQKSLLSHNKLILQLRSGRDITTPANHLVSKDPTKVGVKSLSLFAKLSDSEQDNTGVVSNEKSTVKKLRQLLAQSSAPLTLPISLTLAQVYINSNKLDSAAEVLESTFNNNVKPDNVHYKSPYLPGLIGSLVSIYTLQNRPKAAVDLIAESFKSWSSSSSSIETDLTLPASILAESDVHEYRSLAFDYFKNEYSLHPESASISAGLLSTGNETAVENYESILGKSSLIAIQQLTESIDVNSLNESGVAPLLKRGASSTFTEASTKRRKVTKTKRRSKLPKDYDAAKQPDPERWLPKRDRSTWKPKRKDKRNAKQSTQGGAVDNTTELGIQTPTTSVVQSKSSSAASKNKKKKKAKR
ncbi:Srp72p [Sugiyamaella lignohabitans]|uniref:Signal recognition particle subunit SRP72 n=1 Tax=Sugiyamaella lignohabitans TaxID=796027 RepID=A0A167DBF9_9ASCO|nr:Srp72p [Sugiyamaella lignohabitans]ANB12714.1 Srp72p [Sugiyamaella lignohabitans]